VKCSCCDGEFRRFRDTGTPRRLNATCPRCGSHERHRLIALYLKQRRPDLVHGRVLHFAPEQAIVPLMRDSAGEYVTTDLIEKADVQADITDLPWGDDRWDVIVCSHILEHVPDDRQAMRELRRVLAPGGHAIVMVPQNHSSATTDEDPTVADPQERFRRFGQPDHVRMYGLDLADRLAEAGFAPEAVTPEMFSPEAVQLYRLELIEAGSDQAVYVCS